MNDRSSGGSGRSVDVLLVESEPDDVAPFLDSFEATERADEVHVVADGDSALDFLHDRGEYADTPRPDLILLDLHVRGTSGEDVLAELDEQRELRPIPVIVMTTSDAAADVARSYELNANAYVRKPDDEEAFVELATAIEDFWLKVAQMPPK